MSRDLIALKASTSRLVIDNFHENINITFASTSSLLLIWINEKIHLKYLETILLTEINETIIGLWSWISVALSKTTLYNYSYITELKLGLGNPLLQLDN